MGIIDIRIISILVLTNEMMNDSFRFLLLMKLNDVLIVMVGKLQNIK